ncbi:hypothetical protein C7446_2492 [Kushneria sinocarnis]|uniref:Cof subfamily protein (Haloacid dehalogenase superfamily)/HAD superfamily hydrolase (TIGR01484 family) n=1 Tax=Kushneria sinocarnis TaxID=595502 RepID=A0A420WUF8_9GAMM|nr:HAD family hydrolase [Kushneria sinocarnis]RKQ97075.1 hypothetical protein C7446_2492 [Kushneria sinocarnis]
MSTSLIVSDLDHTLLNAEHRLDDITIETFQALAARGHHLAIASGRHFRDIAAVRRMLGVSGHIISTNGAHLHAPDDSLIFETHVPMEAVAELMSLDVPESVRINLYTGDRWLIDAPEPALLAFHASTGFSYEVTDVRSFQGHDIGKVLFIGDPELLAALETEIRARLGESVYVTYSLPNSLEIMNREASKGRMLQRLMAQLEVPAERTLAFGDNLNDIDMLQTAGRAYAVANAHTQLTLSAPHAEIIGSNVDAGVAYKLRELFALD